MKRSQWKWMSTAVIVVATAFSQIAYAQTDAPKNASTTTSVSKIASRVYFVSPTGDDAAAGSKTTPWKTIQKAANTMTAGDSVSIAAGVYRERVSAKASGEAKRPISYIGQEGAIIDGLDLPGGGVFNTDGQSHLIVRGLTVRNAMPGGLGISVGNSTHVRVERCHTSDTAMSGIHVDFSSNVAVLNNEVEKACMRGGEESISIKRSEHVEVNYNHIHHTMHEGIDVKEGAKHVRVIGNHVHDVERQGLYADAWNVPTYDIRFFNNVVHDCGFGFVLASEQAGLLSDVWFCNNIVYNNRGPGMGVTDWGEEFADGVTKKDIYFINNTIVGNGRPGSLWGGGMYFESGKVDNLVVKNNIFSGNVGAPILTRDGKRPAAAIIANNLLFGEGNVEQPGTDNIVADPLFADAAKGDFRLKAGSPAIDRGLWGYVPVRDHANRLRDTRPDLGAHEYSRAK